MQKVQFGAVFTT